LTVEVQGSQKQDYATTTLARKRPELQSHLRGDTKRGWTKEGHGSKDGQLVQIMGKSPAMRRPFPKNRPGTGGKKSIHQKEVTGGPSNSQYRKRRNSLSGATGQQPQDRKCSARRLREKKDKIPSSRRKGRNEWGANQKRQRAKSRRSWVCQDHRAKRVGSDRGSYSEETKREALSRKG